MSEGTFKYSNIVSAPQKSAECTVGWIVHCMIGIMVSIAFVGVGGKTSYFDESHCVWCRHLSVRIVGQLAGAGICITRSSQKSFTMLSTQLILMFFSCLHSGAKCQISQD